MKNINHETNNPFAIFPLQGGRFCARGSGVVHHASFLTGMALAVVLGSMFALSTPAFAFGGGGGGESASAPKITKVVGPAAGPEDKVAEVRKPVVDPEDETPAVGELKTEEPEEKTLVIEDPDEDKTETKPDERTVDLPETGDTKDKTAEVVEATVGFARRTTQMEEGGEGASLGVVLSRSFPQPVTARLSMGGDTDAFELSPDTVTFRPGETSKVVNLAALEDADSDNESVTIYLSGNFPDGVEYGEIHGHVVTVIDNDPVTPAVVSFGTPRTQMKEGETASLKVLLSKAVSQTVTLTLSEDSDENNIDFSPGTVTFRPGSTEEVVNFTAAEDEDSADERVTIHLVGSLPAGVRYGEERHGHVVTIIDDDISGTVGFAAGNDITAREGDTVRLTVASTVAPVAGSPVSFDWSVSPAGEVDSAGGRVTITGPAKTGTFEINIANDDIAETEEHITITLSDGNPHDLFTLGGSATHTIAIPANDNTITFSAPSSASIAEEGGTGTITATINNPIPASKTASVTVTSHGSAVRGSDYRLSVSGGSLSGNTWTLPAGVSGASLIVTAVDNSVDAEDKTLTLDFAGTSLPDGWSIESSSHAVTIVDDDSSPEFVPVTVSFATHISEVKEGDDVELQVELSKPLPQISQPVTLNIVASGTAVQGTDYEISPATLTIPAGATGASLTASLTLTSIDDDIAESDETVTLTLTRVPVLPDGVTFDTRTHTVTIVDDDVAEVTVEFARWTTQMTEGGTASLQVDLSEPFSQPVTAALSAVGDTEAFELSPSTVTFQPGETSKVVNLTAAEDDDNFNETVAVVLGGDFPDGVRYGEMQSHLVTIVDNDVEGVVEFVRSRSRVSEPTTGTDIHNVSLSVSRVPAAPFDLAINVSGSAAFGPDADDDANASFPVSISSASIAKNGRVNIPVTIRGDDNHETEETIILTIDNNGLSGSGFRLGAKTQHAIFIHASDNIIKFFPSGNGIIRESYATSFTINLYIENPLPAGTSARVELSALHSGGATSDDYELVSVADRAANGTVRGNTWTLPTGRRFATIEIRAVNDNIDDDNESVTFALTNLTGARGWSLGSGTQTVNIIDDDGPAAAGGTFKFAAVSGSPRLTEGDPGGAEFRISFDNPPLSSQAVLRIAFEGHGGSPADLTDVSFSARTSNGMVAAYDENAQTLTIPAGATSPVTFTIAAVNDDITELKEEFVLRTSSSGNILPTGYTVEDAEYTGAIAANDQDDDEEVAVSVGFDTSVTRVTEGENVTLRIAFSAPLSEPLTLFLHEHGDVEAADFRLPDAVTFREGSDFGEATLSIVDDDEIESDETIIISLDAREIPAGMIIDNGSHTVTIVDNDREEVSEVAGEIPERVDSVVGFKVSSSEITEGSGRVYIEAHVTPPVSEPINLNYQFSGNAKRGASTRSHVFDGDYTILWARYQIPENTVNTNALLLVVFDDVIDEEDETFTITINGELPEGVRFGTRTHTVTIIDDDDDIGEYVTVGFARSVTNFNESAGSGAVEVVLSEPLDEPLTVSYGYPNTWYGRNNQAFDYYVTNRYLTFQPGETSKSFLFDIADNRLDEWNKVGVYTLSGDLPEGVRFGRKTHTINFRDNDTSDGLVVEDHRDGMYVREYEGNDISLINDGHVVKIEALHRSRRNPSTNISIENLGTVDTDIVARNYTAESNGLISIKNSTTGVVGGNVIGKHHDAGNILIENHGRIAGEIRAIHFENGDISVRNGETGVVGGNVMGKHHDAGNVLIENHGRVAGDIRATHFENGNISIENHKTGNVEELVDVAHYGDGDIWIANRDYIGWVYVRHYGNGVVRYGGDINNWLDILGNYEGSDDTQLNFHVSSDDDYAGMSVRGNVTGQSRVSLVVDENVVIRENTHFEELIEVDEDYDAEAGSFTGEQVIGAFNYVLEYEKDYGHVWNFMNKGLSDTAKESAKIPDDIEKDMEDPSKPKVGPDGKPELGLWGDLDSSSTDIGLGFPAFVSNDDYYVGSQVQYYFKDDRTGIRALVETEYNFDVMNFRITPLARLTWTRVGFEDFVGPHRERISLLDGDTVDLKLGLSFDGEYRFSDGLGYLYGGLFMQTPIDGKTSVKVSGVTIANERNDMSIDGKLGLSYEWDEGYSVYGEASALHRDDADEVRANLGVRIDF